MKVVPSTSAAITSNEKTFPIFARKLASGDVKDFATTAYKLAAWLDSEKAYYAAARPKIIELLEIALRTFVDTLIHHSAATELSENLRRLVQVVTPFGHLFPEPELQTRLARVILDLNMSLSRVPVSSVRADAPPQESVPLKTTSSPLQTSTFSGRPQPMSMSLVPLLQEPTRQTQPSLSGAKTDLGASIHDASRPQEPPHDASLGKAEAIPIPIPIPASPVTNVLAYSSGNTSATMPSKPLPKRTRRTELSEELVARDLDWFRSNQNPVAVNGEPSVSLSKAGEPLSPQTTDAPYIPRQSPTSKTRTARMVPSRRLPPRISSAGPEVFTSTSPPASEVPTQKPETVTNAEAISVEEASRGEDAQSLDEQPAVTFPNGSSIGPEIPKVDPQVSSDEAPLLSTEVPIFTSPSLPPATVDMLEPMDLSTSDLDSKSHLSEPPSTPVQFLPTFHLRPPSLPPPVAAMDPPLNLDFSVSQILSSHREQYADNTNPRRFDGEITVIHSIQGKPFTHTHVIDISLNESTFSRISKWICKKSHSDASQGVTISLACYHLPEIFRSVNTERGKYQIEDLISQSSCSWPQSNRLSLHVNEKERRTVVTLSPPLFLTPDQFVDISSLMQSGENTLEIRQQDDLSQYLLVLLAHPPTQAQLAELKIVKTVDERWNRFLDAIAWRVVTEKSELLDTAPAGVVGVL